MDLRVGAEDARQRIAVGCNWNAVPGREYPMNDCVKINVAKVFEIAFYEMLQSGERNMDRLMSIMERHLKRAVEVTAAGINHLPKADLAAFADQLEQSFS